MTTYGIPEFGVCEDCAHDELNLKVAPWIRRASWCVFCYRANVVVHALARCPSCDEWGDADDIMQCVPGDADSEHTCGACRRAWARDFMWDDSEGMWVERV